MFTKKDLASETFSQQQKRTLKILRVLSKSFPKARIALNYKNNIQLLVAVILSAQCTDKKANEITEPIFKKYKTAADFAAIPQKKLEKMIHSTGFYRAKAKNILAATKTIRDTFSGSVPKTMREILTLKGVARKTANVVLGNAYGVVVGIAVDTNVWRNSRRFGLTNKDDPVRIEEDLMKLLPRKEWFGATYRIIDHGRAVCTAKDPRCDMCPIAKLCPSAFQFPRFEKRKK